MFHNYFQFTLAVTLVFSAFQMAVAEDKIVYDKCFPIGRALDHIEGARSLDADQRDTVDTFLEAYFVEVEKRSLPMKLYLKYDETRDNFVLSESGEVKGFHHKVLNSPLDTKICGISREDGKIGLGMSTSVRFKNQSGSHTLLEILDGVKDGKSHHKKNLGGAKALFVPKMTHIAIIYDDVNSTPNVSAIAKGRSVQVEPESYGEMWVINAELLEDNNIETITIGGGAYELFPVPSIKKMNSLGIK